MTRPLGAVVALCFLLALAPSALASGSATIALKGPAAKSLRAGGVAVSGGAGAKASSRRLVLPVARGKVGSAATLRLRGRIAFRVRGGGRLRWSSLRMTLGKRSRVTARVAGKRRTVLALSRGTRKLDAATGTARVSGARVRLSAAAARIARRKLGLRRLGRSLGTLRVRARVAPGRRGGGGGGDNPVAVPPASEPPLLARPAGAVDVTSASIVWHVRDSFIRYVNAGEGTSVSGGAADYGPKEVREGTTVPLQYKFSFAFPSPAVRSWHHAPSGVAGLYYRGTVNFSYKDHGIDLDAKDAEVELNGGASRAIMRFDGRDGTKTGNKRAVLIDLDPARARSRTVSPDGRTITLSEIPGKIPQGTASSVFAGFYGPGEDFGWISVSYTTG